ncbi:MAG: thiamine ABC transporter substrate-binding protein [Desulfomonilia bacterium]|jgi:thiamine transport system substrate-binding protein|nr:thiamine ABC transporter substrate-binding protein [Deltaproteobacteria bacterium]MDX9763062.1 thiamine ABC transporter substrate-binding protein [Desulfomonilia bacterium]
MMKYKAALLFVLLAAVCLLAGCPKNDAAGEVPVVRVMVHDSFSIGVEVLERFEKGHGIRLLFLKSGDAGAALNQAILSKAHPLADVFYGVDNTFMSRALGADIFVPYSSPLLASIDESLVLDKTHRLVPVDYGDVCVNYDRAWFDREGLPVPQSLDDLVRPEYAGLLVVENPATSSPGLAFLLATVGTCGEDGFVKFWQALKKNRVLVTDGWEDAYWGKFSATSKGGRPLVVSYSASPAAEVYFAEHPPETAPTAAMTGSGTAFRQIEFAGILKGSKQPESARKVIDFLLDTPFQQEIPLKMFMFPANKNARLPEVFIEHARLASRPVILDPEVIAQRRDAWIRAWTETVLQ